VKYCFCILFSAGLACAQSGNTQSASTLYTVDINGHLVDNAQYVARDGDKTQLEQSLNGRTVPLESSDFHVLTDTPNHRVTETIVRRYSATGQLASTERIVTDESKSAAGSTLRATTYRSDINGNMVESERRVVDSQVHGDTTTSDVNISRPGLSGSFETTEKRNVVTTMAGNTTRSTEAIERPSGNGQFYEAARIVKEENKSGDKTTSSTALYELNSSRQMALARQEVATTTKTGNGGEVTELNTYAPSVYGIAQEQGGPLKLREQQTIVKEDKNGVVTETTSVSRPTLADPNRLGNADVISTLVCKGTCKGPLPALGSQP
jgi:hypothetical protein